MKIKETIRTAALGAAILLAYSYPLTRTARANGNWCLLGTSCWHPTDNVIGQCMAYADLGVQGDSSNPWTYDCACYAGISNPYDVWECVKLE